AAGGRDPRLVVVAAAAAAAGVSLARRGAVVRRAGFSRARRPARHARARRLRPARAASLVAAGLALPPPGRGGGKPGEPNGPAPGGTGRDRRRGRTPARRDRR